MRGNAWTLISILVLVILILFLAYWTTRWIAVHGAPKFTGIGGGTSRFRVLSQIAVGRNERLILVRIQDRCCLLGVTEHQITLLKELEQKEAEEWLAETEKEEPPGFWEILNENLRKRK